MIAGVFELKSWRWIFRFFSMILIPGTAIGWFLIPKRAPSLQAAKLEEAKHDPRWKRMDPIGVALMLGQSGLLWLRS